MSLSDHNASPFNTVPPVIWALVLVMAGAEVIFSLGARGLIGGPEAIGWRVSAIQTYAFSGEILDWMLRTRQFPVEHLMRLVTYPFVHGAFTHALIAIVMLLALGKMVAETLGQARALAIFVVTSVAGALVFGLALDTPEPLFGAFPPVYGMIGAFTYLLYVRLGEMGEARINAFRLIGVLLGLQLIFGVFFGAGASWVAELGAFIAGFGLTVVLVPGGAVRLINRIRRP